MMEAWNILGNVRKLLQSEGDKEQGTVGAGIPQREAEPLKL